MWRTHLTIQDFALWEGVQSLRLLDMVTASTHTFLVVRRHVDLMRVGSMTCWHR